MRNATIRETIGGIVQDNNGNTFIGQNSVIRKINSNGIISKYAGTDFTAGYSGDGGSAQTAKIVCRYSQFAIDNQGNIIFSQGSYASDDSIVCLRKINAISGIISTITATSSSLNCCSYSGDNGLAINAQASNITGIAIDNNNNIYFSDQSNNRIRKINGTTGIITTFAGNGMPGYSGNGGLATSAEVYYPSNMTICNNYLCFIDGGAPGFVGPAGHEIRKIDLTTNIISFVDTVGWVSSDYYYHRISSDVNNNIYCTIYSSNTSGFQIKKINIQTNASTIIANPNFYSGYSGDSGPALNAKFSELYEISSNSSGDVIYVGQGANLRVLLPQNLIIQSPINKTSCFGDTVVFNAQFSPLNNVTYNWQLKHLPSGQFVNLTDNAIYSGSTTNTLSINGLNMSLDYNYYRCIAQGNPFVISGNGLLRVKSLPSVIVNNSAICLNNSATLTASGALSYLWSNSSSGNSIIVSPTVSQNYTVIGTDANNCKNTAVSNVTVVSPPIPEICIVLVDSITGKNLIVWEKTPNSGVISYVVHKLSGVQYLPLDTIPYDSLSVYIDYSSVPESHADRYKLSVIDTCNNESSLSNYIQTMSLGVGQGVPSSTMVLNWNFYEDESANFVPSWYYIYRGTTPNNMQLLDSVSSVFQSYNDMNISSMYYYKIGVTKPFSCVATSTNKNLSGSYSQSISNIKNNEIIEKVNVNTLENTLLIYPSPTSGVLNVKFDGKAVILIYDVLGKEVLSITHKAAITEINLSNLTDGIYQIKFVTEAKIINSKIILRK